MPKFQIGQLVEFSANRFQDEDDRYEDYNIKYKKGGQGYVLDVYSKGLEGISESNTFYKIKVGMSDIIDVPETDLFDPNSDVRAQVEAKLRAAQAHKAFKDTERIGGSKKEKAAYKHILSSDLAEIEKDEATAIELVKKDKVYPKVDIPGEQAKGTSGGAAYLKVKMRESFSSTPPNNKDKRKIYVGFIEYLVKKFDTVISVEEFEKIASEVIDNGLDTIVKTLSPEAYESSLSEKQENHAKAEFREQKIRLGQDEKNELREKIKLKYPEQKSETIYKWFEVPADDEDKIEYDNTDSRIDEETKELSKSKSEISSISADFIKKLGFSGTYYSLRSITKKIFEEVFGIRFANFITRYGSESAQKIYEEAKRYEPLSEAKSKELTEAETKYTISRIKDYTDYIARLKTFRAKEQFDAFFGEEGENKGTTGFWGYLNNKHAFYRNIRDSIAGIEWYKNKMNEDWDRELKKEEKYLDDTIKKYLPRENNWDWALNKKNLPKGEKSELTVNQGKPLDYIKRTGGYMITDADVTVESIKEKFGFKDVEFGQSIKDQEAREHIRHFLGAMADLGDILDINIIKLNQIGQLKITFGSRGAGKASAMYFSLRKLINLTKSRGDGAVAHEYAHYIDNIIPKINNPEYSYENWASVTKKSTRGSYYSIDWVKNTSVKNAINDIFEYIYTRKKPVTEENRFALPKNEKVLIKEIIEASDKKYSLPSYIQGENIDDFLTNFFKTYPHYKNYSKLTNRDKNVLGFIVNKFGYKSYEIEFETPQSAFYAYSLKMSSGYWTREWELFARAWETYIYDKLEKAGRANNYLVSGDYFDRPERVYPQGDERSDLFELYERFVETIKREYNLAGFVKFTDQRTDEYLDLNENNPKEEVTTGVIVDAHTDEV